MGRDHGWGRTFIALINPVTIHSVFSRAETGDRGRPFCPTQASNQLANVPAINHSRFRLGFTPSPLRQETVGEHLLSYCVASSKGARVTSGEKNCLHDLPTLMRPERPGCGAGKGPERSMPSSTSQ